VALLCLKFALIMGLALAFGNDRAVALRCAMALAPAGEFGFVLLSLAGKVNALPPATLQVVLAAMLVSMLLAPLLLAHSERIVLYLVAGEWENRALQLHQLALKTMAQREHVIVCGYGRSGQSLARFLELEKIAVAALDADPLRVKEAAAAGESVSYGDATRREVLTAAGLARASALVVSFADPRAAQTILVHVRELRPDLPVIVRTFDDTDVDTLKEAGAREIVAEVVEGSLMLATQTMLHLGVPLNRVLARLRSLRAERYQLMRGFFPGVTDEADADSARLHALPVEVGAAAVGKTLAALHLEDLGVSLHAWKRGALRDPAPAMDTLLAVGDVLILDGAPEALARAEIRVMQGV
jgi:CPA2 family monovalent cation:H+ antiporter-2